ncbi:MAG: hypothetical protein ABI607_10110 [Betaproteobacteria bacterium]
MAAVAVDDCYLRAASLRTVNLRGPQVDGSEVTFFSTVPSKAAAKPLHANAASTAAASRHPVHGILIADDLFPRIASLPFAGWNRAR